MPADDLRQGPVRPVRSVGETGAPAASARGVSKDYSPGVRALAGVDLDLPRGAVTALAGPNGAGKTTLLRILAGLLPPTEGTVELLGQPAATGRPRRELRRRLGYVPQEPALDPEMTGRETLALLAALHGLAGRERAERVDGLARAFGVATHLDRRVGTWSGGQKRRLHLAAGMIHDPELLLLDEPTAGLDLAGSDLLWSELERRARAGRAVAVATHDLAAVERCADQVVILDGGRIAAAGNPATLVAEHGRPELEAALDRDLKLEALQQALAGIEGIGAVTVDGRRCRIEIPGGRAAEAHVLAALASLDAAVLQARFHPPGLAQVFRSITGHDPSPPPSRTGAPREGKK